MFRMIGNLKPHSAARNDMKNGYNIRWTDNALDEFENTIESLAENFTDREIKKLTLKIEGTTKLIA